MAYEMTAASVPATCSVACRALGCVMYEMTALRPAFNAFNIQGLIHKVQHCAAAALPLSYSVEWCGLVKSMLRKVPEKRPTVMDLMQAPCLQAAMQQVIMSLLLPCSMLAWVW